MNKQLEQFQKQLKNGRLAQSFLIVGPEGTGKFSAVVKMTGFINNLNEDQLIATQQGTMTDIILIEAEVNKIESSTPPFAKEGVSEQVKKTNSAKAGKVKNIITKKQIDSAMKGVGLKNFQLNKKVIIIRGADKMTNTAANSLLKLIEEPTDNLVIFLMVNNEDDILTTIKSRCQIVRFSFIDDEQIAQIIQEEFSIDQEIIGDIVNLAGGRIELARQYANDTKKIKVAQKVRNDFRNALRSGKLEQIKLVDKLIKEEQDLLWVTNEWVWYLKFFLEKNIQGSQPVAVIKKVHSILKNLLITRNLIRTTNVSKKVQLENFFVQI